MIVHFDPDRHEYRDEYGELFPSVTQIIKAAGRTCYPVSDDIRDKAWKLGTAVHWVTALDDQGLLKHRRVPTKLRGYRDAWRAFKQASGFQVRDVELPFISPFGYAGTIDRTGTINFQNCVVDLKTGVAIPEWVKLQTVAYGKHRFGEPCRRIAVRLSETGTYRVREFPVATFNSDFAEFYSMLKGIKSGNHN